MAGRRRPPAPQPDLFVEAGLTPAPEAAPRRAGRPEPAATDDVSLSALAFAEAPVPLVVLANRRIAQANPAAAALFGWPRHLMQGRSARMLHPPAFVFGEDAASPLDPRDVQEDERVMQARGGKLFWARARGRSLTPERPRELTVWSFERIEDRGGDATALTPREREIALHIVKGRSPGRIAQLLGLSPRTVEGVRASLMRKLGARDAADLAARILQPR